MTSTVLRITSHQELIDLVDAAFGFHPTDSLVVVALGSSGPHARVDLTKDEQSEAAEALAEPLNNYMIPGAAVIAYTDDELLAGAATGEFAALFTGQVKCRLWVGPSGLCRDLDSYDTTAVEPAVTITREDVAADLQPVPDLLEVPDLDLTEREAASWLAENIYRLYTGEPMAEEDAARYAWCVTLSTRVRDFAWSPLNRRTAAGATDTLRSLVPLLPEPYRSKVVPVLAFTAWLSGQGALGWVAHDINPTDSLAVIVSDALEFTYDPNAWVGFPSNLDNL